MRLFIFLLALINITLLVDKSHADCLHLYQKHPDRYQEQIKFYQDFFFNDFRHSASGQFLQEKIKHSQRLQKLSEKELHNLIHVGFKFNFFCVPWPHDMNTVFRLMDRGVLLRPIINQIKRLSFIMQQSVDGPIHVDDFPEKIFMRDRHGSDVTGYSYYYLDPETHRIFTKAKSSGFRKVMNQGNWIPVSAFKAEEDGNYSPYWYLHDLTGGPILPHDEKIVEMQAQAEVIAAISNKHQLYLYKPTDKRLPTRWRHRLGVPWKEGVFLPADRRSWSLSVSAAEHPEKKIRTTEFMHPQDLVTFYEDLLGQKIAFGLTITLYVLAKDGHSIFYWDTGLPATFSRGFLTPENGDFEATNLSAAGSTIMVIGYKKDGSLAVFTRMYDYEINGSIPGLTFIYDKEKAIAYKNKMEEKVRTAIFKKLKKQYPDLTKEEMDVPLVQPMKMAARYIPLSSWQEAPSFPAGAQVSDRISIFTNGQGNCARTMRVEGINAEGTKGYFLRSLCDKAEWLFYSYPQEQSEQYFRGKILNNQRLPATKKYSFDYEGTIVFGNGFNRYEKVELLDFHYYQTPDQPSRLRFLDKDTGNWTEVRLHTSDGWIFTPQKRKKEFLIGHHRGEPKIITGTLDFDSMNNGEMDFSHYWKVPNLFTLIADEDSVYINVNVITRRDGRYLNFGFYPPLLIQLNRKGKKENPLQGYYTEEAQKEEFILAKKLFTIDNLKEYIKRNKKEQKHLLREFYTVQTQNLRYGAINSLMNMILGPSNVFTSLIGVQGLKKHYASAARQIPQVMPYYVLINAGCALLSTPQDIFNAMRITHQRINEYQKAISNLKKLES